MADHLTDEELRDLVAKHAAQHADPRAFLEMFQQRMAKKATEPVSPRVFIEDPEYLNAKDALYPKVMEAVEDICSGKWVECVLTGSIGCGKTTVACYVVAYSTYLLSFYEDPHRQFGLDPSSEIEIIFQSVNLTLAKEVGYDRFRSLVESAPYFNRVFPFDKSIKSKLVFPKRIEVKPVAGSGSGALGRNIVGGVLDELRFMENVQNSTRSGSDVSYDQARVLYNALSRRRLTRFLKKEKLPGMVCLVSSANYRGQFMDEKIEEARAHPGRIYVYDKRVWEVKPDDYSGETFPIFIGDEARKPRILDSAKDVHEDDAGLVMPVPVEYRNSFEMDLLGSMRDLAGINTTALHPFLTNVEKVAAMFNDEQPSIFLDDWCDFDKKKITVDLADYPFRNEPHAIHVDLALTRDSCGFSVCCVPGFLEVKRDMKEDEEYLPFVYVAGLLEIRPPRAGEIEIDRIRDLIYGLSERGLNIQWVSSDSFQSRDMRQLLHQRGFWTQEISMDKTTKPYNHLKGVIYDGRISAPYHERCHKELLRLEFNAEKDKVDHPIFGDGASKDIADSLAGSVWSITRKNEIWNRHRIPSARRHLRVVPQQKTQPTPVLHPLRSR